MNGKILKNRVVGIPLLYCLYIQFVSKSSFKKNYLEASITPKKLVLDPYLFLHLE